jgi:hypothetical protein
VIRYAAGPRTFVQALKQRPTPAQAKQLLATWRAANPRIVELWNRVREL